MPLNQNVIDSMEGTPARIGALTYESPDEKRSEAVIMTKVLPADINKDYHHDSDLLIEKVNGETVHDFRDFYHKVQSSASDFITLQAADDYQLVIDRKEAIERQPEILAQYGVNADRSKDLQALDQTATPAAVTTAPAAVAPATPAVSTPPAAVAPAAVAPAAVAVPVAPAVVAPPVAAPVAPTPAVVGG
jgi:hypothetical protein